MKVPNIHIKDYTYILDDNRIAKYPLENRDSSKLLVYKDAKITDAKFIDIDKYLPENSLCCFNNTKVIQARMLFKKDTGAKIEIFCLEPVSPTDTNLMFQAKEECVWDCIVGNSKKWKDGALTKLIDINGTQVELKATRLQENNQHIKFTWNSMHCFADVLEASGIIPIPPYLNRKSEELDQTRYQTVYSEHKGSVAAPTAGLHYTKNTFDKLKAKNISIANVTLHVGAGTFKPVKCDSIKDHEMHTEHFFIDTDTIDALINNLGNITATGTTTVRTLESLYWIGVKLLEGNSEVFINQWDAYNLPQHFSAKEALTAVKSFMLEQNILTLETYTGIMIAPGYNFKIIDRLVTNFHQPDSTLLLLIAAFTGGNNWKQIYQHALDNDYRFLSYGDSSLLYRNK